jgi:DNA-binding response OmpR family regulator
MQYAGAVAWVAGAGHRALEVTRANPPDLAILDAGLADGDALRVLRGLHGLEVPTVVLASGHDAAMRLEWLEAGADGVVEKPLSLAELRLRCRGLLRRRAPGIVLRHGALEVNRVERCVTRAGETIPLTNREYALLEFLLQRRGEAVSRSTLLERVWNRRVGVQTNVVDVYVNYLRRKLHDRVAGPVIRTVRGQGYCIPAEA